MKVVLFMAMSVNGMVARKSGDEDFLSHENWKVFTSLVAEHSCLVIGRKTFEVIKTWGVKYSLKKLKGLCVVVSKKHAKFPKDQVVANSPKDAIRKLAARDYKSVLLAGGPTLNASFLRNGLINEIVLAVEPKFISEGRSIFSMGQRDLSLALNSIKKYKKLVILRYAVKK